MPDKETLSSPQTAADYQRAEPMQERTERSMSTAASASRHFSTVTTQLTGELRVRCAPRQPRQPLGRASTVS